MCVGLVIFLIVGCGFGNNECDNNGDFLMILKFLSLDEVIYYFYLEGREGFIRC